MAPGRGEPWTLPDPYGCPIDGPSTVAESGRTSEPQNRLALLSGHAQTEEIGRFEQCGVFERQRTDVSQSER